MNHRTLSTCLTAVLVAAQAYAQAPTAPTNLVAARSTLSPQAGVYESRLTWQNGSDSYSSELQRREWSSGAWITLPPSQSYSDEYYDSLAGGLKAATQYSYRVRNMAGYNGSAFSNIATVTTSAVPTSIFLEAEAGEIWDAVVAADRPGYTGSGFVDFVAPANERLVLRPDLPQAGTYRVEFRYANGGTANRPLELTVNGTVVAANLAFPPTGGWTAWSLATATFSAPAGSSNVVTLRSTGASGPNIDSARFAPVFTGARINFQPAGAPVPPGYVADTGAVYGSRGNGFTYGWNAAIAGETRDRNNALSPDQRYDTLVQTQRAGNSFWELAIPNGRYAVSLTMGDPGFTDSVYAASIEGVNTAAVTPGSSRRWTEQFRIVDVTDGRLTIRNATGAVNNKFAFIEAYPRPMLAPVFIENFDAPDAPTFYPDGTIVNGAARGWGLGLLYRDVPAQSTDNVVESRIRGIGVGGDALRAYTLVFGHIYIDYDIRDTSFRYYAVRINPRDGLVSLDRVSQNPNEDIYSDPVSSTLASAPVTLPHGSYSTWKVIHDSTTGRVQVYVDRGSGYGATPLLDVVDTGSAPRWRSVGWDLSARFDSGLEVDWIKVNAVPRP